MNKHIFKVGFPHECFLTVSEVLVLCTLNVNLGVVIVDFKSIVCVFN